MASRELATHIASLPQKSGPAQVAFFDLDGTLIAGNSLIALAREAAKKSIGDGEWQQSAKLLRELAQHASTGNTGRSYHSMVRLLSEALTGVRESTLENLGQSAYHHFLARQIYTEAISLVEAHRSAGHKLVLIASASRFQAEPVARVLGIDEICCTQLEVRDDCFTGRVKSPMCVGEGKAMAMRRLLRQSGASLQDAWFYTNSSSELPILQAVGHPVAVNPKSRLAAHADEGGWPALHFRSRGGLDIESLARTVLTLQGVATTSMLGKVTRGFGLGDRERVNATGRLFGSVAASASGLTLDVEGEGILRANRPCIFIYNHQSLLDGVVLMRLLKQDVVAFCKKEMADKPFIGPLLKQMDTIFVERDNRDQSAVLQQALGELERGRSLVIAPEGTRSTLGDLQPFKQGAFYLAKRAKVPIVPIVLHNVKDALPKGGLFIRPAKIRITVLDPVLPEDLGSIRGVSAQLEAAYRRELRRSREAALPYKLRTAAA